MIKPRKTVSAAGTYSPPLEGRAAAVRLDFNENTAAATGFDQYPEYGEALEALAGACGLNRENVLLTNGSSEGIWLTAFSYIEPGRDMALISSPTFSLIPHYLQLCGAGVEAIPVTNGLEFDIDAMEKALYSGIKLVMLASPDNPTGAVLSPDRLISWLERYPSTLFFIDEAYAEYNGESVIGLVQKYNNLLVARTFSKAWGLAGLRLGYLAGSPDLIREINKVRIPYNVNSAAVAALKEAIGEKDRVEQKAGFTKKRKERFQRDLQGLGYSTVSGHGNFFLLNAGLTAAELAEDLRRQGVLVRDRSSLPAMEGKVRISIGTEAEMQKLLSAMEDYRNRSALIFDLDDTLIDTSLSYTVIVGDLVEEFGGGRLELEELMKLKSEGGFNDDWAAARELLRRRDIEVTYQQMQERGTQLYLQRAPEVETLMLPEEQILALGERFRLFVVTGRYRREYETIWGEKLNPFFEEVLCVDDYPELPGKPAPDQLRFLADKYGLERFIYVGNSVDDMRAARDAGGEALGLSTTATENELKKAGARLVLAQAADLPGRFGQ